MPASSGPGTLDPYMASSAVELEVIHNLFESLVTLDAENDTRPMLAAKAAASEDFKTYTFELRKGVKFRNGQEMTSADVKASFERFKEASDPPPRTGSESTNTRRPIPTRFVVHLKEHQRRLLDTLK